MEDVDKSTLIELTAEIVSAFVSNNSVRPGDMPGLLASLHAALSGLGSAPVAPEPQKPAVNPKKSVTDDYIISLEDGRKLRSMKRYLGLLGMTPDDYRKKWGLPKDYPMVAPGYAKARSELAKTMGLGRKAAVVAETPALEEQPAKRRRRPAKAA